MIVSKTNPAFLQSGALNCSARGIQPVVFGALYLQRLATTSSLFRRSFALMGLNELHLLLCKQLVVAICRLVL
jgi:hypothetical protein